MRYFPNPYQDYQAGSPFQIDSQLWLAKAQEVAKLIFNYKQHAEGNQDGGLYVGPSGIAYALWKLSTFLESSPTDSKPILEYAQHLMKLNLQYTQKPERQRDKKNKFGFLLGGSGVYAVAAAISHSVGNQVDRDQNLEIFCEIASRNELTPIVVHRCGSDELFVGRAGYIAGAIWINSVFNKEIIKLNDLYRICDSVVRSGQEYVARKSNSRQRLPPLMYSYYDTEYLGAAHGLCAILQMLISVPGYIDSLGDCQARDDIKNSIDFLLAMQTKTGNFPCAMDEAPPNPTRHENEELVHWCHGAPGMIYMLAKAYLVWKEEKYLIGALNCGECVWKKGLLKKGPGICHGVAGSGYVFLTLYRLTKDVKHLYRAQKFAEFLDSELFRNEARQPDCPLSLYEGWAGTLCFLLDLSKPDKAHFPFSEIMP